MKSFQLLKPKICACQRVHTDLPDDFKIADDDYYHGVFWNCECRSTLYTDIENINTEVDPFKSPDSRHCDQL
jgi:hypothetical protein